MTGNREDETQTLINYAREAWVRVWETVRWDYWVRLQWRSETIGATTAHDHLERLVRDLHRQHRTVRVVSGFHADPFPHAHASIGLSRSLRGRFLNPVEFRDWLQLYWYHGPIWAERFDASKRSPEHGGALEYLSRDPGTVVFG
jgi:hypothetical protein